MLNLGLGAGQGGGPAGLAWAGLGWAGLGAGLAWAELGWAGLGWAGQCEGYHINLRVQTCML